ncbi:WASH complex subunit 1 [Condylostylus longicornis]|uniref:WASH complex subunit 1 n=1 Tax=Condylostylus longicornis TaxID=2530218 RepID=UPI00244E2C2D|nr:WASH complex subunit 1 [Condylostylus longicornis]
MDSLNFRAYEVPLIPSGLRHEETIIQTANALEYLNNTINDIFNKIDERVERNNEKIREIQQRIQNANKKIESLIGSKRAICVYSPAKFPALHVLKDIPSTFSEEYYKSLKFKLNTKYDVENDLEPLTQNSLQHKLQFYHVKETQDQSRVSKLLNASNDLGPIPIGLKSINSLLLYNTFQNVYAPEKEKGIFRSQNQSKISEDKNELSKKKIEAPPISITSRQLGTERKLLQKLFYTPKLNDAPDINLPLDLPDLPGVAANIHFDVDKKEKIAPSLFVKNEKNIISQETVEIVKDAYTEKINIVETKSKPFEEEITIPTVSTPPNPITVESQLPPVPPPPPPPLPSTTEIVQNDSNLSAKAPIASEARSNLMEAIRKAGGTRGGKLRAAADVVSNKMDEKQVKPNSNTLMDDLHKKLLMRRKGISGSKDNDKNTNVLDRLSSLIPPPPKPSQGMYSSTSDNDNDNDDWD